MFIRVEALIAHLREWRNVRSLFGSGIGGVRAVNAYRNAVVLQLGFSTAQGAVFMVFLSGVSN
jgi:hypothetical protein